MRPIPRPPCLAPPLLPVGTVISGVLGVVRRSEFNPVVEKDWPVAEVSHTPPLSLVPVEVIQRCAVVQQARLPPDMIQFLSQRGRSRTAVLFVHQLGELCQLYPIGRLPITGLLSGTQQVALSRG